MGTQNIAHIKVEEWPELDSLLLEISEAADSPLEGMHLMAYSQGPDKPPRFALQIHENVTGAGTGEWLFCVITADKTYPWYSQSPMIKRDTPLTREVVRSFMKEAVDQYRATVPNSKG